MCQVLFDNHVFVQAYTIALLRANDCAFLTPDKSERPIYTCKPWLDTRIPKSLMARASCLFVGAPIFKSDDASSPSQKARLSRPLEWSSRPTASLHLCSSSHAAIAPTLKQIQSTLQLKGFGNSNKTMHVTTYLQDVLQLNHDLGA